MSDTLTVKPGTVPTTATGGYVETTLTARDDAWERGWLGNTARTVAGKSALLVGPMSGYADWNRLTFENARKSLLDQGWTDVTIPHDLDAEEGYLPGTDHDANKITTMARAGYLERTVTKLLEVDTLVALPSWWSSRGASVEVLVGLAVGKPFYELITARGNYYAAVGPMPDPLFPFSARMEVWDHLTELGVRVELPNQIGHKAEATPVTHMTTHPATIFSEAEDLVYGDRNHDYGHPAEDFARTAKMWSALLGTEVRAEDVALCMVGLKLSREINRPKRDNRVDAAGYLLAYERVLAYKRGEEE